MRKKSYADGSINVVSILDEYIHLRDRIANKCNKFFFAVDLRATIKIKFLKCQFLGKNSFLSLVKSCCVAKFIKGSGTKSWVTTHGLRGTLDTILF